MRLWRTGRRGLPDTAVDVGALPGTPVFAPVDGKVVFVQRYKLYSRYPDFEIHIMPKDVSGVDVVLLHVDRVRVSAGDMVSAGITQIAVVRDLSMLSDIQLAEYTPGRGDHTHVQINRVPAPGSIWITGGKGPVIKRLPSPSTESSAAVH